MKQLPSGFPSGSLWRHPWGWFPAVCFSHHDSLRSAPGRRCPDRVLTVRRSGLGGSYWLLATVFIFSNASSGLPDISFFFSWLEVLHKGNGGAERLGGEESPPRTFSRAPRLACPDFQSNLNNNDDGNRKGMITCSLRGTDWLFNMSLASNSLLIKTEQFSSG